MNAVWICRSLLAAVAIGASTVAPAQPAADSVTVSGSVAYRQRIAMPPEAVLSVRIEDVSRADAPAAVLAETHEAFGMRQVPIPFALTVPRAAIDPRARYALRASINVGAALQFTTDRHHPVLTAGAADKFDLLLVAADSTAPRARLALPATFTGVLPCADCAGIAHTLTLRPEGLYRLRSTYLGKPGAPVGEVGRWSADAGGTRLVLARGETSRQFALIDAHILRQLDRRGEPFKSSANIELRRTAKVDAIIESLRWRGEFRYRADAATFTDCVSGLRWPVATLGDYLSAERAYTQARGVAGAPLIVDIDGRLEMRAGMEGPPREHLLIERFGGVQAGATCTPLR